MADLERVPLVAQVIHEALRLYPPAWIIARHTLKDDEIGGVPIPAGRLAIVSPYVTHRRPDLFEKPESFRPERFRVGEGPAGGFSKYAYFPFGAGPRICVGNGFAMMETQLLLATLRRRFRLTVEPGASITPLPQLTLRCRNGVPVRAEAVG
jgi:cytochrome P450